MTVNNSIARRPASSAENKVVEYKCGEEIVKLSPSIIRKYLVSGNGNVTDQEIGMFINLCRFQHLNPFLREVYLIKFGNQPATMVVGKDAITKRAMKNPAFEGQQAGVCVQDQETGQVEYRIGSLVLPGETIVGGWAKVFVKGYQQPIEASVSFKEYVGLKNDGSPNGQWARKPATMIRKVALVQALREAFPEGVEGLYDSAEVGVDSDTIPVAPVILDEADPAPAAQSEAPTISQPVEEMPEFQMDQQQIEADELPGGF